MIPQTFCSPFFCTLCEYEKTNCAESPKTSDLPYHLRSDPTATAAERPNLILKDATPSPGTFESGPQSHLHLPLTRSGRYPKDGALPPANPEDTLQRLQSERSRRSFPRRLRSEADSRARIVAISGTAVGSSRRNKRAQVGYPKLSVG